MHTMKKSESPWHITTARASESYLDIIARKNSEPYWDITTYVISVSEPQIITQQANVP